MRTTVAIDDHVLRQAKARAAAQGMTLGQLVEDALRGELARERPIGRPAKLPVSRHSGGLRPGIEPTTRGLLAALDEGLPLDEQR